MAVDDEYLREFFNMVVILFILPTLHVREFLYWSKEKNHAEELLFRPSDGTTQVSAN